jgi:hypothetical protein
MAWLSKENENNKYRSMAKMKNVAAETENQQMKMPSAIGIESND